MTWAKGHNKAPPPQLALVTDLSNGTIYDLWKCGPCELDRAAVLLNTRRRMSGAETDEELRSRLVGLVLQKTEAMELSMKRKRGT